MKDHQQMSLEDLQQQVEHHNLKYHQQDKPEIPDARYDELKQELRERSTEALTVGAPPSIAFNPVVHESHMLSLGNVTSEDEFRAWYDRVCRMIRNPNPTIIVEPKIDGLAIRVTYRNGKLAIAATRGDGETGEDVTHTVSRIAGLPVEITEQQQVEFRGEVYIPRMAFQQINAEREEMGEQPFANPRNAAAGGVRNSNPDEAEKRQLHLWIYTAALDNASHQGNMRQAQRLGMPVIDSKAEAVSVDEAVQAFRWFANMRDYLDYETDGVVFKLDSLELQERAGSTGHEPRWAIAWKFPSEQKTTMLKGIDISIGRFGRLTPVAVLEPVEIGGVTVQSASLHNMADLQSKDIRPGEEVMVERAGDVIPQVTGPVDTDPTRDVRKFSMPERCPSCNEEVRVDPEQRAHWCDNSKCPSRLPEQLRHFVSRQAMDIEHLGEHWTGALVEAGLVKSPADLYYLTKEQLVTIPRMGQRNAERILESIQASRNRPLQSVLYSLGVHRLGRHVSRILADEYRSVRRILSLTPDQIANHQTVGPIIARHVYQGLNSPRVREMVERMENAGVRMTAEQQTRKPQTESKEIAMNQNFVNKTFVVTGKLQSMTRNEIESFIRQQGGSVSSSVNGSTSVLVVGEKPGSKLAKARQLNVQVISENALFELVEPVEDKQAV